MISLDTETELIAPGLLAPPLVCVSWATGQASGQASGLFTHLDVRPWLDSTLAEAEILGLNIAYDMGVICAEFPDLVPAVFAAYRQGRIRDVGLDQRLIDIAKGRFQFLDKKRGSYSLAGLCKRILGEDLAKEDTPRLTYGRLRGAPLEAYTEAEREYAIKDAIKPLEIRARHVEIEAQWADEYGPANPLLANGPARAYAAFALHLASCWGVRSNAGRCQALADELQRTLDEAADTLRAASILRADGTKNVRAARERMQALGSTRLTEKGAISLDQEACEATGDPVMLAYTTFARADTLRSRVADLAEGSRVPLQPQYDPLKDTGRTSARKPSSKGPLKGFQTQNMPQLAGSRETLEPRPGRIFFGADFTAAEMHTLAQQMVDIFGESTLADTLNAGLCPHVKFGAALRGMSYEEADASPERAAIRKAAKPGNFGIPGGMGRATFAAYAAGYGVALTEAEAGRHIHTFKRTYPCVGNYLQQIGRAVERGIDTICLPRSGRWRGGLRYSSMANTYFQSPCADGALAALCEAQRRCYSVPSSPLYGCRVWGFVHDEILGEAPIDQAAEAAEELARVMCEEFNVYTPDVPTGAEPALFWQWSKSVETNRDASGRLVPSDPQNACL